jgi:hypothetical protein
MGHMKQAEQIKKDPGIRNQQDSLFKYSVGYCLLYKVSVFSIDATFRGALTVILSSVHHCNRRLTDFSSI